MSQKKTKVFEWKKYPLAKQRKTSKVKKQSSVPRSKEVKHRTASDTPNPSLVFSIGEVEYIKSLLEKIPKLSFKEKIDSLISITDLAMTRGGIETIQYLPDAVKGVVADYLTEDYDLFFSEDEFCHQPYQFQKIRQIPVEKLLQIYNIAMGKYQKSSNNPKEEKKKRIVRNSVLERKQYIIEVIILNGYQVHETKQGYLQTFPKIMQNGAHDGFYKKIVFGI